MLDIIDIALLNLRVPPEGVFSKPHRAVPVHIPVPQKMVYYFKSNVVDPPAFIYVGKDKVESM
jgi:hypothetical protein